MTSQMPKWLNQFVKDDRTERVHSYCTIRKSHQNNWDCQYINAAKICRRDYNRDLPLELWLRFTAGNAAVICRWKCDRDLPLGMQL